MRMKMPLFVPWSAQNSARIWKSLYAFLVTRWLVSFALSATIAPPSARQFASPTRSKFSSPLSPSMRVVQPLPGTHDGMEEHAASASAAAGTSKRFILFSSLKFADLHLAPFDRRAGLLAEIGRASCRERV